MEPARRFAPWGLPKLLQHCAKNHQQVVSVHHEKRRSLSLRTGSDGALADSCARKMIEEVEECVRAANGSTDIKPKLLAVLRNALTTDQLHTALERFEIGRKPNRITALESVARSARIIGRILGDIGRTRPVLQKPGGVLVQAASVFWGVVEVAIPGTIWSSFFTYRFGLLCCFFWVMIVGGTVFSQPMQSLGFRLLVLALAARLTVSVLRTYIQADKRWQRFLEALFVVGLLVFVGLGLIELQHIYTAKLAPVLQPRIEMVRNWFKDQVLGSAPRLINDFDGVEDERYYR